MAWPGTHRPHVYALARDGLGGCGRGTPLPNTPPAASLFGPRLGPPHSLVPPLKLLARRLKSTCGEGLFSNHISHPDAGLGPATGECSQPGPAWRTAACFVTQPFPSPPLPLLPWGSSGRPDGSWGRLAASSHVPAGGAVIPSSELTATERTKGLGTCVPAASTTPMLLCWFGIQLLGSMRWGRRERQR